MTPTEFVAVMSLICDQIESEQMTAEMLAMTIEISETYPDLSNVLNGIVSQTNDALNILRSVSDQIVALAVIPEVDEY